MITSMTGFGLVEKSNSIFSIEINFRSVNSRFFDLNIRLPHSISSLEKEYPILNFSKFIYNPKPNSSNVDLDNWI